MAPLAMENITEEITQSRQVVTNLHECMTKVYASSAAGLCMGFSGGVALQVHYARFIPRPVRALLLLPTAFGIATSAAVYNHGSKKCIRHWASQLEGQIQQI